MKNNFTFFFVINFVFLTQLALAQDFHFSQFENSLINLNPALSGIYNGQHRLLLNYKNQSFNLLKSDGYRTVSVSYDTRFKVSKKTFLGVGANFINDRAGALDFGSDQYKLTTSCVHNFSKDPKAPQFISFGLDFGVSQRSVDLTNAQWPSQHDGNGGFDPNLSGGTLKNNNFVHPDLGIGVVWEKSMGNNNAIRIGFAMHHINRAKVSFIGSDARLNTKYTAHASGEIKIKQRLALLPSVLFLSQGSLKQLMAGSSARLYFNPKSTLKYLQVGAWRKAVSSSINSAPNTYTFLLETQIQKLRFAFSYDSSKGEQFVNNSLEFSLGYFFK